MATLFEGDQKTPFSIATTPTWRGGRYSILSIAPLHPWLLPYNAECYTRRYQVLFFKSLVWLDLGLNPELPDHWRTLNTLGQKLVLNQVIFIRVHDRQIVGACGVMVIVVVNRNCDPSSNLNEVVCIYNRANIVKKAWIQLFSLQLWVKKQGRLGSLALVWQRV